MPLTQVTVENGRLQGVPGNVPAYTVFKGVPYAKPPVGPLRWKAPQPAEDWTGIRLADRFPASLTRGRIRRNSPIPRNSTRSRSP